MCKNLVSIITIPTLVALDPFPPALVLADHSNHERHVHERLAEKRRSASHRTSAKVR